MSTGTSSKASSKASSTTSTAATAEISWSFVRNLGKGGFGQVTLWSSKSGQHMALKELSEDDENSQQMKDVLENEEKIHMEVSEGRHENIIRLLQVREVDGHLQLCMEYADGGSLADKIEKTEGLGSYWAQNYFRQLAEGLEYLHGLSFVHRDIKPDNLLLTSSDVLKISDFGLSAVSRREGKDQLFEVVEGTIHYMAPEIGKGKYRGEPTDVWAAGTTLIEMLTGELPWSRACEKSPRYQLWKTQDGKCDQPWKYLDKKTQSLLQGMLTEKLEARLTIEEVLEQPWMSQIYRNPRKRKIRDESSDDDDEE